MSQGYRKKHSFYRVKKEGKKWPKSWIRRLQTPGFFFHVFDRKGHFFFWKIFKKRPFWSFSYILIKLDIFSIPVFCIVLAFRAEKWSKMSKNRIMNLEKNPIFWSFWPLFWLKWTNKNDQNMTIYDVKNRL